MEKLIPENVFLLVLRQHLEQGEPDLAIDAINARLSALDQLRGDNER